MEQRKVQQRIHKIRIIKNDIKESIAKAIPKKKQTHKQKKLRGRKKYFLVLTAKSLSDMIEKKLEKTKNKIYLYLTRYIKLLKITIKLESIKVYPGLHCVVLFF